jgi:hypothetical protein
MRLIQLAVLMIFVAAAHLSFGQSATAAKNSQPELKRPPMYSALFIVKSDFRTMEINPGKNEMFNVSSIEAKYVKFVTILDSKHAKKIYGEKGSNGVVIVQLADRVDLSKEIFVKARENQ